MTPWEYAKLLVWVTQNSRQRRHAEIVNAATAGARAMVAAASGRPAPAPAEYSETYYEARERWVRTGELAELARMVSFVECGCGHPRAAGIRHDRHGCEIGW